MLVLAKLYSVDNRCFSKPVVNSCFSGFPVKPPSNKALGTRSNCKISGTEINRHLSISTCFWEMAWIFAFLFSLDGLNLADSLDFNSNDGNETFLITWDNAFVLPTNLSLRNSI